jgi:hypothetical protein
MGLQNGRLIESMTQGGKEVVMGRWWGTPVLVRLDVRDGPDQSYSRLAWLLQ